MFALKKKSVNLLSREGFEHTTLGQVLLWALSAGRAIVILTELVVVVAFLSRFWLDRTLSDLHEINASKKKQIEATSKFEANFRLTQQKLSYYQNLVSSQPSKANIVSEIASLLPSGVVLSSISHSDQNLTLSGKALSEEGLAGFLKSLKTTKTLSDVKLTTISLETEGQQALVFTINTFLSTKKDTIKKEVKGSNIEEKL